MIEDMGVHGSGVEVDAAVLSVLVVGHADRLVVSGVGDQLQSDGDPLRISPTATGTARLSCTISRWSNSTRTSSAAPPAVRLVHNGTPVHGGGRGYSHASKRGAQPALKAIHPESSLRKSSLDYWGKKSNQEIIDSLKPGAIEPLITYPDGRIAQGNTRIKILRDRGVDVDQLPRQIHNPDTSMFPDLKD